MYIKNIIIMILLNLTVVLGSETTLIDAFEAANQVLQGAVQGISEIITQPGQINVDFADVRTVMSEMGMAMMVSGESSGEDRAREAAEAAISSPLLEDINLSGAKGILVNVTAGTDITIGEFKEVGDTIKEFSEKGANVVIGSVIDPGMKDNIRVTVVATGLGHNSNQAEIPMRVVKKEGDENSEASLDYDKLDEPAIVRKKAVGDGLKGAEEQEDLLNIPAFLRRQAD